MLKLCFLNQHIASCSAVCIGLICYILPQNGAYWGTGVFSGVTSEKHLFRKYPFITIRKKTYIEILATIPFYVICS